MAARTAYSSGRPATSGRQRAVIEVVSRVPWRDRQLAIAEVVSLVPWRDRYFLYFVVGCASVPALLALLYASAPLADRSSVLFALGSHPWLAGALALVAAVAGLLVWERPGSWSLRAYGAQLRTRVLRLQAESDAEFRRRYSQSEGPTDDAPPP